MNKKYLDSDIKVVLIYVLKRIWIAIIPALILGWYLGHTRGVQLFEASMESFRDQGMENVETIKAEISEQDIQDAEGYYAAEQAYHKYLVFMSDSIRMNTDATNAPETVLTYRIEADNDISQIRDLYKTMYDNGCDAAMDETGGSLITYKAGETEAVFSVVVLGKTLDESASLAQEIKSWTQKGQTEIESTGLAHTLHLVNEVTANIEDSDLRAEQLANIDQIKVTSDSLTEAGTRVTGEARRLYNAMQNEAVNGETYSPGDSEYERLKSESSFNMFYARIGAGLGGVAGLLVIISLYTFKPYVHTGKEFGNIFDTEFFGKTAEDNNELLVNSLVLYLSRNGYKKIGFYSSDYERNKEGLLWLKDELSKHDFSISVFEKSMENGEELLDISKQDAIMAIEKLNKSKIKRLMKVKVICDKYSIKVAAVVAV